MTISDKRCEFHCHTFLSDGAVIPIELIREAESRDHAVIAITDHVSASNVDQVIEALRRDAALAEDMDIEVFVGCGITHVPPKHISRVVKMARKAGAELINVHGETLNEPVAPGTNRAAMEEPEVDILVHPGRITEEEVQLAMDNDILLEITSKPGHSLTNGHVATLAKSMGTRLILNTDAHDPSDLITREFARKVGLGAGLSEEEVDIMLKENGEYLIDRLRRR